MAPARSRALASCVLLALAGAAAGLAAGAPPGPPAPPVAGFGAPPARPVAIESGSFPNPVDGDFLVHWVRPAGLAADARLPLVAFLPGFGAPSEVPYRAWIEHLAGRGAVVVYPVYPSVEARSARTRYDAMWAGIEAAVRGSVPATGARPDASRLGVIGHSFGGGAAPAIAARAAARGWGRDRLWILCLAPWYDLDRAAWASLPPHAYLLAVAYEDDKVCDPGIAGTFPSLARTIPAERKAFRCLRTDPHGSPALRADHGTPLTFRGVDAYDTRGTWQVADALAAAAAGDETARRAALGDGAGALDLGRWSDGVPVRAPLTAWPPESGPPEHPRRQWRPGGKQEEIMRRLLRPEAYTSLPLPAPDAAPASRLPASERFLAPPPAAPWPPAVAKALEKGPVLVRSASATLSSAAALAAAGVAVVDAAAFEGTPLADALAEREEPTALLVAPGGEALLWRRADDPNLAAAVLDLVR